MLSWFVIALTSTASLMRRGLTGLGTVASVLSVGAFAGKVPATMGVRCTSLRPPRVKPGVTAMMPMRHGSSAVALFRWAPSLRIYSLRVSLSSGAVWIWSRRPRFATGSPGGALQLSRAMFLGLVQRATSTTSGQRG